MDNTKGFFQSLFDFSFTVFITTKIIKVLYGLSIIIAGLLSLVLVIIAFGNSETMGVITLLFVAPLIFLLCSVYSRVLLEIIIVVFRIAEHLSEMAAQGRKSQ